MKKDDKAYSMTIQWSEEDKVYIAKAPALPGCMADGKTQLQAYTNLQEAIKTWVATAKELGRPIPEKDLICMGKMEENNE